MARRALMLREGIAPVRDRLLTMLFIVRAAARHRDPRAHLPPRRATAPARPGLEVLLVSDELPEADKNPTATYLAQRTQIGSGNTRKAVAPRNRASAHARASSTAAARTASRSSDAGERAGSAQDERVLTTTAWSTRDPLPRRGRAPPARSATSRCLIDAAARPPSPDRDDDGPGAAARPAARRAVDHPRHPRLEPRALPGRLAAQGRAHRHAELPDRRQAAQAQTQPGGRGRHRRRRQARPGRHPPQQRLCGARPGGARDPEARQPLRSLPAGAGARSTSVLRFAYEWQFSGGRAASGTVSVP